MRILITGIDGYLGWALAQHLTARGHEVAGADAFYRRQWVQEMHGQSAIPIDPMPERLTWFRAHGKTPLPFYEGDLTSFPFVRRIFEEFAPEAIVHFGECPSAPYSMIDVEHATWVQTNNVIGTMNILFAMREHAPGAHLVKLGTMGEYGTPNVDIPEGFFEIEYRGRKDRLPFPRQAGSWYHWSKVHGSNNIMFACRMWNLRSTDIMQGVVYGTHIDAMTDDSRSRTRLDFDQCFGTVINRFACQAVIGDPLTPYGAGQQKRGFLPLRDSVQCITLALEHPPATGEYRVFNQFEECYNVTGLAALVQEVGNTLDLDVTIRHLENPRIELEQHHYQPDRKHLLDLGYQPTSDMRAELRIMLNDLIPHHRRIEAVKDVLTPSIRWDGSHRPSAYLPK